MMNTRKIVLSGVIALAVLIAILTVVPSALASYPANCTYFNPGDSTGVYCQNNTIVQVRVNTSVPSLGGMLDIYFDPNCVNITGSECLGSPWSNTCDFAHYGNHVRLSDFNWPGGATFSGDNLLANITLHCINDTNDCTSFLNFSNVGIGNETGSPIITTTHNGTIDCTGAAGQINVDIRADGINVIIFNAPNYPVYPGTVTEDGITINNQTAMGAMVVYCQENGINVNITTGYWGEYVIQIGDNASDYNSWMYAVDDVKPGVGGAAYSLSGGEKVHWYNADYHYYEVYTTLDKTSIYLGDNITATVTWKNTTGTYPLNGATVYETATAYTPGSSVGTTGLDGNCTFEADETGRWYVYAEHSTYGSGIYNYPAPYYDCLPEPDLEITDIWTEVKEGKKFNTTIIHYNITNNGDAKARRSVSNLTVDSIEQKKKGRVKPLAVGDTGTGFFRYKGTPQSTIKVCADYNNRIAESNETNNCLDLEV